MANNARVTFFSLRQLNRVPFPGKCGGRWKKVANINLGEVFWRGDTLYIGKVIKMWATISGGSCSTGAKKSFGQMEVKFGTGAGLCLEKVYIQQGEGIGRKN